MSKETEEDRLLESVEKWRRQVVAQRQEDRRKAGYREVHSLKDTLKKFAKEADLHGKKKRNEWAEAWAQTVGDDIAEQTQVKSYSNGVLTVEVKNASLKAELETFHNEALMESLAALLPKLTLRSIRFQA